MKTSHTIQNFLQENNPEKLKEFVGLFNPTEPELVSQYNGILDKLKDSSKLTNISIENNSNNFRIDQNLFSVINSDQNNAFVLHKFNNNIKILYQGYDSENESSGELHFFANKLFLASFSYPKLMNGNRIQFLNNLFGVNTSEFLTKEYISICDHSKNIFLIENGPVLKVHYFNKDTLISLHQ